MEPDELIRQDLDCFFDDFLIEKKRLFTLEEASKYPVLLKDGIIYKGNTSIGVRDHELKLIPEFIEKLYHHFSEEFAFSLSTDLNGILSFLHNVDDAVSNQESNGYLEIRELAPYVVAKWENETGMVISDYFTASSQDNYFFLMLDIFNARLRKGVYQKESIWVGLKEIAIRIGSPNKINGLWKQVESAITEYSLSIPEEGKWLYNTSIQDEQAANLVYLSIACLDGLITGTSISIRDVIVKLNAPSEQIIAATVLSNHAAKNNTTTELILDLLSRIEDEQPSFIQAKANLLLVLLNHEYDEALMSIIKAQLSGILYSATEAVSENTLRVICHQRQYSDSLLEILKAFIISDKFKKEDTYIINNIFVFIEDLDLYFDLIRMLASRFHNNFSSGAYEFTMSVFYHRVPQAFEEKLIGLIIDDEGYNRFAGMTLLMMMQPTLAGGKFDFDVLCLSGVDQHKLVMALFNFLMAPKELLPLVLPLRKSQFMAVHRLLDEKILALYRNYGYTVIQVLKELLDSTNPEDAQTLSRLEEYDVEYTQRQQARYNCKELSSRYNHARHLREYNRLYQVQMSEVQNAAERKSIFGTIANNVTLARPGGWKIRGSNEVQKLSTFSVEMQLPIGLLRNSEKFEREKSEFYRINWKQQYQAWEPTILSSKII